MDKIMDNIMPGYSFSHQFYRHWTHTPTSVREAIVDELSDIIDLLHPNTALAEFRFTQPDLDAHIDSLYAEHYAELAKAQQTQINPAKQEAQTTPPAQTVSAPVSPEAIEPTEVGLPTETRTDAATTECTDTASTVDNSAPINTAFADALVQELGTHIDDYLSDQMAQISEDLKSWLRDEIGRQLSNLSPKNS